MSPTAVLRSAHLRRVTRTVSDGTGLPQGEVLLLAAAIATVAASVAAWRGLTWAVNATTDGGPLAGPTGQDPRVPTRESRIGAGDAVRP
jgi:hypothetical protein